MHQKLTWLDQKTAWCLGDVQGSWCVMRGNSLRGMNGKDFGHRGQCLYVLDAAVGACLRRRHLSFTRFFSARKGWWSRWLNVAPVGQQDLRHGPALCKRHVRLNDIMARHQRVSSLPTWATLVWLMHSLTGTRASTLHAPSVTRLTSTGHSLTFGTLDCYRHPLSQLWHSFHICR